MAVVQFECFAIQFLEAFPAVFLEDDGIAVVRCTRLLVGHFQKEQKRNLLGVGHVRKPIIPQHVREISSFVDNFLSV